MNEIQIKTESLPQRCEICHKTDKFYPEKNLCLRCNKVSRSENNDYQNSNIKKIDCHEFSK